MSDCCVVLVTCSGAAEAGKIAEALVSAKAAACVNIIPRIRSVYRWKGRINKSAEAMMVIKSRSRLYGKIERLVKKIIRIPALRSSP